MSVILTRAESDALRDACMSSAHNHAESDWAEWGDIAAAFLNRYAQRNVEFTAEEVTNASLADPIFPQPEDGRAWGATFARACRSGIIQKRGYGVSTRRHSSPTILWSSQVYVGACE